MGRATIVPALLARLEPRLEDALARYRAAPQAGPTLPRARGGGKLNIRALVRDLALPPSWEQHFYDHAEVKTLVNAVAREMQLAGIGEPPVSKAANAAAARLAAASRAQSRQAQTAAEMAAENAMLRERVQLLEARLAFLQESGLLIRTEGIRPR